MKWDFWHMRNKDKDRRRKKLGLRKTSFFFSQRYQIGQTRVIKITYNFSSILSIYLDK